MALRSITSFRPSLLWAAFDLCIPPLALLGMAWAALFAAACALVFFGGSSLPLAMLSVGAVLVGASLVLGWFIHCRQRVPLQAILAMPWFLIRKVRIYLSLIFEREKVWLKTERD